MKLSLKRHPNRKDIFITTDGQRVFKELPVSLSSFGYHTVHIGQETVRRHTLVAETFRGIKPKNKGVRHMDGNPENDHPSNLRWGTQKQNMDDAIRHGTTTAGEKNRHAKLTAIDVIEIRKRRRSGETGKGLAAEFGVSQATICDIVKHRTW
jgi:hypothetical protein